MDLKIGEVLSTKTEDGALVCTVDFGIEVEEAVLYGLANENSYPVKGDSVLVNISEQENSVVAVFRPHQSGMSKGELWLYGRNSSGEIQSTIKLKSDGTVVINDGDEPAVKGESLNTFLTTEFQIATAFGPGGPALTPIPESCFNRTILV